MWSRGRRSDSRSTTTGSHPELTPFWKKPSADQTPAAEAHWEPSPFSPDVSLHFARDHYLETIQAERRRLAGQQ